MMTEHRPLATLHRANTSWIWRIYIIAAYLFACVVAVQVFLAGLNVFLRPLYWGIHASFGHASGAIVLAMLVLVFVGRLPAALKWQTGLLLGLMFVQYNVFSIARGVGVPGISALHAVNALLLFWVALSLGQRAQRLVRLSHERGQKNQGPERAF